MFDRGSREGSQGPVTVQITLDGGEEMQGRLVLPPGRGLSDVLNSAAAFIEFEATDGERMYIAKTALQSVKPTNVPAKPDLWAGSAEPGNFDPLAVLGLKAGATREEARDAYVRMAKIYHPDRYAAVELPREVRDYLAAMVRRVNAAHQALENAQRKQAAKQEAVFTRNGGV
jgi:DnaJ-domain-containing protein 1